MRTRKTTKPGWKLLQGRGYVGGDVQLKAGKRELPRYAVLLNLELECITGEELLKEFSKRWLGADRADPVARKRVIRRFKRRLDWLREIVEKLLTGRGWTFEDVDEINKYLVKAPVQVGCISWPGKVATATRAYQVGELSGRPFVRGRHAPDRMEITVALFALLQDIANKNELEIPLPVLCPLCGKLFPPKRRNHRFCSKPCQSAFHNQKKTEVGIDGVPLAEYHRQRRRRLSRRKRVQTGK